MKILILLSFFVLPFALFAQIYQPQWLQTYGGDGLDNTTSLDVDQNGNPSFLLSRTGDITLDISGTPTLLPAPSTNGWMFVQTDTIGNVQWIHDYGDTQMYLESHSYTSANEHLSIIQIGTNTEDVDFGPGVVNHTGVDIGNFVFCKYDNLGNYVWSKEFFGNGIIESNSFSLDDQDNIYMVLGIVGPGSIDVDPSVGVVNVSPTNGAFVLVKYDPSGNYLWHKEFIAPNGANGNMSGISPHLGNNSIYLVGGYLTDIDFDPGAGTDMAINESGFDACITKLDTNGNYIWSKRINSVGGTDDFELFMDMDEDNNGDIYLSGLYSADIDVDPGAGQTLLTQNCAGCIETFVVKIDSAGNFVWEYATAISSPGMYSSYYAELLINASNELVLGVTASGDMDLGYNSATFNVSTSQNGARGVIHLDMNGNFIWAKYWDDQYADGFWLTPNEIYSVGDYLDPLNFGTSSTPLMSNTPQFGSAAFLTKMKFDLLEFDGNVYTTPTSQLNSCDGTGEAYVIGGLPPYQYYWTTQTDFDNLPTLDSACYGNHTLLVVDSNSDTAVVDYYVTDDPNYNNWVSGVITDTVYLYHENCALNYGLPIDSAGISTFNYLYNDSLSTDQYFYIEATYYQAGNSFSYGDTVLISNSQNVLVFLNIFCFTKQVGSNKIILMSTEGNLMSIEEEASNKDQFKMYPNPASETITILGDTYDKIIITDLAGKVILQFDEPSPNYDISVLSSGLYLVHIHLSTNTKIVGRLTVIR